MVLLDFTDAPEDALRRIFWLGELAKLVDAEIDEQLQQAYFQARIEGRALAAIELAPHNKRDFIAMTRRENERRGRLVRWGDKLDYGPYGVRAKHQEQRRRFAELR